MVLLMKYSLFICAVLSLAAVSSRGNLVLMGENVSLSFLDAEANFAPSVEESGECGVLYVAEPLDACAPLSNKVPKVTNSPFVLIIRGGCTFDIKVKSAQNAGFKAAIVYDNEDRQSLISMAGNSVGIHIHAVFVSMDSGEMLKKYAGRTDLELWIIPTFDDSAWSIMAISFISLLIMSAVLATCYFVRRHQIGHEDPRVPNIREFHGMSSRLVKAMPSLIFTLVTDDNCTSTTCAICLEDYSFGEKLRILPCRHKFHAFCVDSWLTTWRTFCPICKQDARAGVANLPPSEFTPLFSSGSANSSSIAGLSSFHSSMAASFRSSVNAMPPPRSFPNSEPHSFSNTCSPAIQIDSLPCQPQSSSFSSHHISILHRSYSRSPALRISRSFVDFRNSSSQRSHSTAVPISSSMNSSLASFSRPGSSDGSPSYLATPVTRLSFLRHGSELDASEPEASV